MKIFGEGASAALKAVKELYDQHLVLATEFKNLREVSGEALTEYRRLHEKLVDRIEVLERERVRNDSDMHARVAALEARLGAMTEQAIIAAVRDQAREIAEAAVRTARGPEGMALLSDRHDPDGT